MNFKNRITGSGVEKAGQILAHPSNYRIHNQLQQKGVKGSLDEIGWIQQVIINKRTGRLIDGHLRVKLALREGEETEVPVIYVDLSENEEKLALSLLDPLAEMAMMDKDIYKELLDDLNTTNADLQATLEKIAEENRIDFGLGETQDAEPQIDMAEELNKVWKVKSGDLWQVGEHKLLCGDSTKAEDVKRLMGDDKPMLMVTDPPYGIEYDAEWRKKVGINLNSGKMGKVKNDDNADWTDAWRLFDGDVMYIWHAAKKAGEVIRSIENVAFEIISQIVWAKDRFAISRGDYHWKHEPCFYAVRKGKNHQWLGARDQCTVWDIPAREDSGSGHSTQKPLECMMKPIQNHSSDFVYDPFLGSGTTMVACQNLNRKCRGIEISENYCAVILQRMKDAFPDINITKQ